jgi:homeobox protein cut-like
LISPALDVFTEIDLAETQKQLDKTALELVESQKENLIGRKKLAEQTRGESAVPREQEMHMTIGCAEFQTLLDYPTTPV